MSKAALTEPEFLDWMQHPVTRALMQILYAKRAEMKERWESGAFTDYEKEATVLVNVGNLGTCKGYAFVTDFTYEQYLTEIDDGESQRIGPSGGSSADQSVRTGTQGGSDSAS